MLILPLAHRRPQAAPPDPAAPQPAGSLALLAQAGSGRSSRHGSHTKSWSPSVTTGQIALACVRRACRPHVPGALGQSVTRRLTESDDSARTEQEPSRTTKPGIPQCRQPMTPQPKPRTRGNHRTRRRLRVLQTGRSRAYLRWTLLISSRPLLLRHARGAATTRPRPAEEMAPTRPSASGAHRERRATELAQPSGSVRRPGTRSLQPTGLRPRWTMQCGRPSAGGCGLRLPSSWLSNWNTRLGQHVSGRSGQPPSATKRAGCCVASSGGPDTPRRRPASETTPTCCSRPSRNCIPSSTAFATRRRSSARSSAGHQERLTPLAGGHGNLDCLGGERGNLASPARRNLQATVATENVRMHDTPGNLGGNLRGNRRGAPLQAYHDARRLAATDDPRSQ
jgi:hypothetical protein